jgi:hypothetical protein
MAALIEFLCVAKHESHGGPAITLEQRSWAYCATGAGDDHEWTRIDPTAVEILRSRPGNGRYFVPDEGHEPLLTGDPAR